MKNNKKFETNSIRAGSIRSDQGEHSEALYLTSSFIFKDAEEAAARFANTDEGNVYSRFTNPSVSMFEDRLAALEGAEQCVATSTGMSAILACVMSLCNTGDHIIVSKSVFGTTVKLFDNILTKWGLKVTYVSLTKLNEWKSAVKPNTKLFFVETPSNPLTEVCDITSLSELAHESNSLLVVDNCFSTPAHQLPIKLGADVIIHSATKYLDGQGRCLGGAVLGKKNQMSPVANFLRSAGTSMSPFNAWIFFKGLETLKLRMDAHATKAMDLALWLEHQESVGRVYYPGLPSHPQHALAMKQQSSGGGIVSFEVSILSKFLKSFIIASTSSVVFSNAGTRSTITHPASTTHSRLSQQERDDSGIKDNLIRIAVGLEDIDDIKTDLLHL